ncbi:MAG: zf-HC2 domain-containing protein [Actinobacteria bacterium]|nr:zf-HC2 domain-containing protein [Actinomycetota bacterium]
MGTVNRRVAARGPRSVRKSWWKPSPRKGHRWVMRRMSEHLDGTLSSRDAARVDEHVGVCPGCRQVLATLAATVETLAELRDKHQSRVADAVIDRLRHA